MVNEFKRNLLSKHYQKQMSSSEVSESQLPLIAGAEKSGEHKVNNASNKPTKEQHAKREAQRAKRQAIYLKIDERSSTSGGNNSKSEEFQMSKSNISNENNNNNNNNTAIADTNSLKKETLAEKSANDSSELDSTAIAESPISRRRTLKNNAHSTGSSSASETNSLSRDQRNQKRCGIYEPNVDAEFVCDILNAFDTYLQDEEDAIEARAAATELHSVNYLSGEACITNQPGLIESATVDPAINASQPISTASGQTQIITPYAAQRDYHQYLHENTTTKTTYAASSFAQIFNFVKLSEELNLSRSLNRIVIAYHQPLHAFLVAIRKRYPREYVHWPERRLIRKFQRFQRKLIIASKVYFPVEISSRKKKQNNLVSAANGSRVRSPTEVVLRKSENVSTTTMAAAASDIQSAERNSVRVIVQQLEVEIVSRTPKDPCTMTKLSAENDVLKSEFEKSCATHETRVDKTQIEEKTMAIVGGSCSSSGESIGESSSAVKTNPIKNQATPLKPHRVAPKRPEPPRVPVRDPKTALSSKPFTGGVLKSASESQIQQMKNINNISSSNSNHNNNHNSINNRMTHSLSKQSSSSNNEENIYQPIWKFKTVGEVQEHYETDADYYEITAGDSKQARARCTAPDADSLSSMLLADDQDIEDHGEWETDDEFMFTTKMTAADKRSLDAQSADIASLHSSTVPSLSGSTVAGFSSSTATLASTLSASLTHHLFRNIGIFYSLTQPKLRAIIYDYDRVHASTYFAKRLTESSPPKSESPCSHNSVESNANDSGIGKSPKAERSPIPPPRTTSSAVSAPTHLPKKPSESGCHSTTATQPLQLLPDSVQAWKFMLLDVNYLEDEEDMIVSETEISRVQENKEDIDTRQTQQLNILQRFKSVSIGNLVDLPNEDDKKSIAERMRNKLQRGVFKINVRSPKSDKKNRGKFRRAEAFSLYLEDGMKPKYPIFGAPLDQLELDRSLHPNVPRFVVDCVAYIEQKDCIQQEGLYRASGNKVSIEDLKQKLQESYIYDPKLIIPDDIHTLTGLLKLFFRELGAPLIPQATYDRLGRNLSDPAAIEEMCQIFEEMPEPNRSTLKFIIRHLTNVAACSSENRMPASNLAIVWGPCLLAANQMEFDIGRMNTLAKVLIENYAQIFNESERLVA